MILIDFSFYFDFNHAQSKTAAPNEATPATKEYIILFLSLKSLYCFS